MSDEKLDLIVYIGRFQPFHMGHKSVIDHALTLAKKVLVIVGSCGGARTIKNPFFGIERRSMIRGVYEGVESLVLEEAQDFIYDNQAWLNQIRMIIIKHSFLKDPKKVAIIGGTKNEWYFKLLTEYNHIVPEMTIDLNATDIRHEFFTNTSGYVINPGIPSTVPLSVYFTLERFKHSQEYKDLAAEYGFVQKYKASWACAPYPPTFMASDACLVHDGHVLLIQRKNIPGKGLWAMPGGFLDPNETLEACMIRELREETSIGYANSFNFSDQYLRECITKTHLLDFPGRSERGRFVSHSFRLDIVWPWAGHPSVKAADDAANAEWKPIEWVKSNKDQFFNDHYDGLMILLGA